jgi:hypothetical protein
VNALIKVGCLASALFFTACGPSQQQIVQYQQREEQRRFQEERENALLPPVLRAKKDFIMYVGSSGLYYSRGGEVARSMAELVDEREVRFMDACRTCAPAAVCEADRITVRRGMGSLAYNPCSNSNY